MLQPFPPLRRVPQAPPPRTFVAEVVLAASSVARRALGAGAAGLVWGFADPVAPASTGAMCTRQTPKYSSKPPRPPGTKGVGEMGVSAVLILG